MAKASLYNIQAENIGEVELSDAVFGVTPKASVVHQVYLALLANARVPWADTKDRGEVRGGGKKPWKQKGTGRARHGSIRSPIWKGGGVTFGPLSTRNYKQKINKKMNQAAVRMCMSDKVASGIFRVVETLPDNGKTKTMSILLEKIIGGKRGVAVLVEGVNDKARMATKNLQKVDVIPASQVSVVDLLHHQYVIATKEAVRLLEGRLKTVSSRVLAKK